LTDYEIGLSLDTKQVAAPNGVTVKFSRSFAFRGESWGSGWLNRVVTFEYNYLDYTATAPVPKLPANSAQTGVYVKVAPLQLVAVAVAVAVGWWAFSTTPLNNPVPVLP
jgi:hypothetical protein